MTELLKCPFCGGDAEMKQYYPYMHPRRIKTKIICTSCRANSGEFALENKAIEKWNNRQPVQKVIERLEEERQKMRDESDRFSTLYLDNFESNDPMKAVAESVIVCEQKSFAFGEAIEIVKEGLK